MIRHTLILIYRNFRRFRTTFLINLLGLSTGLACVILIYLWVADELAKDKFHEKDSRLFHVWTNRIGPNGIFTWGATSALLQEALPAEMPEIEYAVGSSSIDHRFTLSVQGKNMNGAGQFVGRDFFKIFSYPLLQGSSDHVLADRNAIVLSVRMAMALFNTTDNIIGRRVEWQLPRHKRQVEVTGVFADVPSSASLQFDFVLSFDIYKEILGDLLHWGDDNAITWLLLKDGTDLEDFNAKIKNFVKGKQRSSDVAIFARKYSDNYLYSRFENGRVAGGLISYVRFFSGTALFILIIACINFMNLATAKASQRIRGVGIKKALGASRKALMFQYLAESLLMAFLSLLTALLFVDLALPQFNLITGKALSFNVSGELLIVLVGVTAFSGLLSGSYPAYYLSGFNSARVLKSSFSSPQGDQWARKGLVIFQFTLAVMSIISVAVTFQQMKYLQTKPLGYERDNIVDFKIEGRVVGNVETFLNELKEIPGVENASAMWGDLMGTVSLTTGKFDWKGRDPDNRVQFEHFGITFGMIELLGIEMVKGRSFSRDFPSESSAIIFNEAAMKVIGLEDPIGEKFNLWGNELEIIGIAKDFHFKSLHEPVQPFFLRITPDALSHVLVKIQPGRESATLAAIEAFYKAFNPGYVFNYQFLDQEYQAQYVAEQRVSDLSRYFAGLTIIISCLGLFGLALFTAERRVKEIGIRKVLGSSVREIIYLISSDFNKSVLIAVAIALPVSHYLTSRWLNTFAYRIDREWWYFVGAGLITLIIAWLTVGMQAWKAAKTNPVNCLKDE